MAAKRVALITGGGAGMGFAVAQELATQGWHTALVDLNAETGSKAAESLGKNCIYIKANTTIYDDQVSAFEETVEKFGGIDFVFANAGIAGKAGFYDKATSWPPQPPSLLVQDVLLTGTIYTSFLAMHYMRRNAVPGGSIVMTASAASVYASPELPLYASSKHAVLGFMRSICGNLESEHIRVSCILPGAIRTTLFDNKTWSQFGQQTFTPMEEVVSTVIGLIEDPEASGKALEISAGEVFDRKQPEFCNKTMQVIMTGKSY